MKGVAEKQTPITSYCKSAKEVRIKCFPPVCWIGQKINPKYFSQDSEKGKFVNQSVRSSVPRILRRSFESVGSAVCEVCC